MAVLAKYDWILALITIFFCASAFGNGANDVANSYATSVAARTLTMPAVGILSMITEFVGAVALGKRVTSTIKNDIIDIDRFDGSPGAFMLTMSCAEFGSASWLLIATRLGFPVSTTQTIVGALVGAGLASQAAVTWEWDDGSVTQVIASWAIAPAIAGCIGAILFLTIKYSVLERRDPLKSALRMIPFYLAFTGAILALFLVIEVPDAPSLEEFGAGKAVGIVLGVFVGVLAISYGFFLPYFRRRVVLNDTRLAWYHIPLGPTMWKDNPWVYLPRKRDHSVKDYYKKDHLESEASLHGKPNGVTQNGDTVDSNSLEKGVVADADHTPAPKPKHIGPHERFLHPVAHLPLYHPSRIFGYIKFFLLQGVTRDCVSYSSPLLAAVHGKAKRYDNRVEHLWTYCQVASAMIMSIAHGSNDVANAVGPWAATYATFQLGEVNTKADTPVWILVVAGFLLGAGFWFFGFHIIRALGNRITQLSPTRGFSMELGAAITVLLASRLGLPVSTTQCLVGATLGVALMNFDAGAVNWLQMVKILCGWVATLPCAGLLSGLTLLMALNTPHF